MPIIVGEGLLDDFQIGDVEIGQLLEGLLEGLNFKVQQPLVSWLPVLLWWGGASLLSFLLS